MTIEPTEADKAAIITVRLDSGLYSDVKQSAHENNTSVNKWCIEAIKLQLEIMRGTVPDGTNANRSG